MAAPCGQENKSIWNPDKGKEGEKRIGEQISKAATEEEEESGRTFLSFKTGW